MFHSHDRPREFFRGRKRDRGLVSGSPSRGGFRRAEPPDAGEVLKNCEKSMKALQFLKKLHGNFAIFSKFFKILSNFWINLEICIFMGSGEEPHAASEFIEILIDKSMEICNFWKVPMETLTFFQFFKEFYRSSSENCANHLGKYGHEHF